MANTDSPHGLKPIKHRLGAPLNAVSNPYYVKSDYAVALFIGDPIVKNGTSNLAVVGQRAENYSSGELPEITIAAAAGVITGVMIGKRNVVGDLDTNHLAASTGGVLMCIDDPNVVFRIKEDSAVATLAATSVGSNFEIALDVAGDADTGISGVELDSDSEATTAGLALKCLRLSNSIDMGSRTKNAIGADAKWDVLINDHTEVNGAAGI